MKEKTKKLLDLMNKAIYLNQIHSEKKDSLEREIIELEMDDLLKEFIEIAESD